MKYTPILALLLTFAVQCNVSAQDEYADNLYLVLSPFASASAEPTAGGFDLAFSAWMPSDGWQLSLDKGGAPDGDTISLYMTLTPPESPRDAVRLKTRADVRASAGKLNVGTYYVDIYWRQPGGEYSLRALYYLRATARGNADAPAGTIADYAVLMNGCVPGGERIPGFRVLRGKGERPAFELEVTLGTPYDNLRLKRDKFERPSEGPMEAWFTCLDDAKGKTRPTVCGYASSELKLGKLRPGSYVCNVQYQPYEDRGYGLTLRALLSTSIPLMPSLPPIPLEDYPPSQQLEYRLQWQPPAEDAAWADDASLAAGLPPTVKVVRKGDEQPVWTLQVRSSVAKGWQRQIELAHPDYEHKIIEVGLALVGPLDEPPADDGSLIEIPLHNLPVGEYTLLIWQMNAERELRLDAAGKLLAQGAAPVMNEAAVGELPAPPERVWLDQSKARDDQVVSSRGDPPKFTLKTDYVLGAWQASPEVDKVEKPDADGVIRVKVSIPTDKGGKGKPGRTEQLDIPLGNLRVGCYRIEILQQATDGDYVLERVLWLQATP